MELRNAILKNLDKNSKISVSDLADMLGSSADEIAAEIRAMEEEK